MLYPALDRFVGRCLEAYGEYCPEEGKAFSQLLKPGDVVVEAGANIGSHTLHMSKIVGATGSIYAFEPQRPVFQLLCANMALNAVSNVHARQQPPCDPSAPRTCLNAVSNVHARQQGMGATPDVMWVTPPPVGAYANFGGIALKAEGRERVDIVTIDSLALERLDLIKIDVEGMEEAVLRGGADTIKRLRPKLYLENDPGEDLEKSASLIRYVRELGYRAWWHLPALFSPENFRNFQQHLYDQNVVSINMLCVRDDEDIKTNYLEVGDEHDRPSLD
ncbi:FkbM family methyltransferase [Acidisoma cladoniae]|uniref:FkbM family methyltransferase n=1 Tax=Acidisoma cladoniae TaxID=3040935 RepID=UPI002550BE3F|nr:FkbM family methyltransferase [Acidisoma sp. PAMC 29798]